MGMEDRVMAPPRSKHSYFTASQPPSPTHPRARAIKHDVFQDNRRWFDETDLMTCQPKSMDDGKDGVVEVAECARPMVVDLDRRVGKLGHGMREMVDKKNMMRQAIAHCEEMLRSSNDMRP